MGTSYSNKKKFEELQKKIDSLCCELETCEEALSQAGGVTLSQESFKIPIYTHVEALNTSYGSPSSVSNTIDATGEYIGFVFRVETGDGLPITVDNTSSIYVHLNTGILNNAGSTLRIGIQDVNTATGYGDGTFDVYADLVGGVNPLVSGINVISFTTGSKTINHGDLIAVECRFISRGGSDSFRIHQADDFYYGFPYRYYFNGALSTSGATPYLVIKTQDNKFIAANKSKLSFTVNSSAVSKYYSVTPSPGYQERGIVFTLPFNANLSSFTFLGAGPSANAAATYSIWSNPSTSPTLITSITKDVNVDVSGYKPLFHMVPNGFVSLNANTEYGISIRVDTALQDADFYVIQYGSGNEILKNITHLGQNWSHMYRTANSGAFSVTAHELPFFAMYLDLS